MKRVLKLMVLLVVLAVGMVSWAKAPERVMVFPLNSSSHDAVASKANLNILGDYGSFFWGEVTASTDLKSLEKDAVIELHPDWDIVKTVNSFSVYEKQGLGSITSPGLYLAHFNGPIRAEWLEELSQVPAVKIVQPFPEFGYIIWVGDIKEPLVLNNSNLDWIGPLDVHARQAPSRPPRNAREGFQGSLCSFGKQRWGGKRYRCN